MAEEYEKEQEAGEDVQQEAGEDVQQEEVQKETGWDRRKREYRESRENK